MQQKTAKKKPEAVQYLPEGVFTPPTTAKNTPQAYGSLASDEVEICLKLPNVEQI